MQLVEVRSKCRGCLLQYVGTLTYNKYVPMYKYGVGCFGSREGKVNGRITEFVGHHAHECE